LDDPPAERNYRTSVDAMSSFKAIIEV